MRGRSLAGKRSQCLEDLDGLTTPAVNGFDAGENSMMVFAHVEQASSSPSVQDSWQGGVGQCKM